MEGIHETRKPAVISIILPRALAIRIHRFLSAHRRYYPEGYLGESSVCAIQNSEAKD